MGRWILYVSVFSPTQTFLHRTCKAADLCPVIFYLCGILHLGWEILQQEPGRTPPSHANL